MASLKATLKKAIECLSRGDHAAVLQHCKAALRVDKSSYEAYLCVCCFPAHVEISTNFTTDGGQH